MDLSFLVMAACLGAVVAGSQLIRAGWERLPAAEKVRIVDCNPGSRWPQLMSPIVLVLCLGAVVAYWPERADAAIAFTYTVYVVMQFSMAIIVCRRLQTTGVSADYIKRWLAGRSIQMLGMLMLCGYIAYTSIGNGRAS